MFTMCSLPLQFSDLMEVLQDMLEQIDRQRRSKMLDEAVDMTDAAAYTRYVLNVKYSEHNLLWQSTIRKNQGYVYRLM